VLVVDAGEHDAVPKATDLLDQMQVLLRRGCRSRASADRVLDGPGPFYARKFCGFGWRRQDLRRRRRQLSDRADEFPDVAQTGHLRCFETVRFCDGRQQERHRGDEPFRERICIAAPGDVDELEPRLGSDPQFQGLDHRERVVILSQRGGEWGGQGIAALRKECCVA